MPRFLSFEGWGNQGARLMGSLIALCGQHHMDYRASLNLVMHFIHLGERDRIGRGEPSFQSESH